MVEKGKLYYQDEEVANEYDDKRFHGPGGRYIRKRERQAYLHLLDDVEGKKVLDVASGTGRLAIDLAERGAEVIATDISEEMLEEAREKADERDLDIQFTRADAEDLPFEDDSFDVVVSQRFLHLVDDHEPYVREMKRVAREYIAYDYFNKWSLRLPYDTLLPMGSYLHSPAKINEMLEDVGFSDITETRGLFIPYGAMRNQTGAILKVLTGLDTKLSPHNPFNSVVYVRCDL